MAKFHSLERMPALSMTGWDAPTYHHVATVQQQWGRALLAHHTFNGDERVLDAGCGTGVLAGKLLERYPGVQMTAVDNDPGMVAAARKHLEPYTERVRVLEADLVDLPELGEMDLVYSNAVLHWVEDLEAAIEGFHRLLRPGGRLLAQFGGRGNLQAIRSVAEQVLARAPYNKTLAGHEQPWHYHDDKTIHQAMSKNPWGRTSIQWHQAPVTFPDDEAWRRFLHTVTLRPYLGLLDKPLQKRFVQDTMTQAHTDGLGRTLDYVRVTIDARRR